MENVIDLTDKPLEFPPAAVNDEKAPETEENFPEITAENAESASRVRDVSAGAGALRALMAVCAALGIISGAAGVLVFLNGASLEKNAELPEFLHGALMGLALLGAEFLLGFSALGDWLVWFLPMFSGMSAGMFFSAEFRPIFIPSRLIFLLSTIFGAAYSAEFSQRLFSALRGNRAAMRDFSVGGYALKFAICAAFCAAAAIFEAFVG